MEIKKIAKIGARIADILIEEFGYDIHMIDFTKLGIFLHELELTQGSFNDFLIEVDFSGTDTETIYQKYLDYTEKQGFAKIMGKTKFSRYLNEHYGYETELRHSSELGKTVRVYVRNKR